MATARKMELEEELTAALFNTYKRAKLEINYPATRFLRMLDEHRGLETARILLHTPEPSDGYRVLWQKGRLDLSVEAIVALESRFDPLFTDEERKIARDRLQKYGYLPAS